MTHIYGLKDPNTGRFCYIGRTQNLKQRMEYHLYVGHGKHLQAWIRALRATGQKPIVVILQSIERECPNPSWTTLNEELEWAMRLAEEGHPILNQLYMPDHLRYPRRFGWGWGG